MTLTHFFTVLLKHPRRQPGQWGLSALMWLLMIGPAAALELRVAVTQDVDQVKVGSSTTAVVKDAAGRPLGELAPMNAFDAQAKWNGIAIARWKANQLWIQPKDGGYVFIGKQWYRGRTKLIKTGSTLTAINYVNLEDYLASVLGREMNGSWPQEALKAQAVAARSYALFHRQRRTQSLFDVANTTASQVYAGIDGESTGTQTAVAATNNQVLTHQGRIIEAVFHSSSGGHTENSEDVWMQAVPYLRAVKDFDQGTRDYQWMGSFTAQDLGRRLPGVGNVLSMTPTRTTPQGRVVTMKVVGDRGTQVFKGDKLRSALGLKSTLFTVVPQFGLVASTNKPQSKPQSFQLVGRGFGHGLGMSQWGAYNMAQSGSTYQQIVQHYYKGTILTQAQVK